MNIKGKMTALKGIIWVSVILLMATINVNADVYVDGQLIDGNDITSMTIDQPSGRINISTTGYTVTKTGTTPPPSGPVVNFSASPTAIEVGGSVTLSWSTDNANACVASGSWSGSPSLPFGSTSITLNASGTYTFTIRCSAADGSTTTESATVTVTDTVVVPVSCDKPPLIGVTETWRSVWNSSFPNPSFADAYVDVPRNGYVAIEFNTADFGGVGAFKLVQTTTSPGFKLGSVSECPGDFNVAPECDHSWGISGSITWSTVGNTGACQLKPNTTYYANFTFTDGADGTTSTCVSRSCILRAQSATRQVN